MKPLWIAYPPMPMTPENTPKPPSRLELLRKAAELEAEADALRQKAKPSRLKLEAIELDIDSDGGLTVVLKESYVKSADIPLIAAWLQQLI